MMVPGSNVLNTALRAIAKQPFNWYAFASRAVQANGQYLANYCSPMCLRGSVQAVPRNLYQESGLDFDKYYLKFFVSDNIIDVDRDVSGDLFTFSGSTYQCLSITPWHGMDGWVEVLAVRILNTPLIVAISNPAPGNYATDSFPNFSVQFNQSVIVTGTPYVPISAVTGLIHGNATYISGSGTQILNFAYKVISSDTANGLIASSPLQSGTISNADGTPANSSFPPPSLTGVTLNV